MKHLKPDLIIIDDPGMKQLPKRSGEYRFEIIMRRHEVRSTVMTSNRPLEHWGKLIGDVPDATAILDGKQGLATRQPSTNLTTRPRCRRVNVA